MLSAIAEQVDGKSFADIVNQRIGKTLSLKNLRVLEPKANNDDLVKFIGQTNGRQQTDLVSSLTGAGGYVGAPKDLDRVLEGWMNGNLIATQSRNKALNNLFAMFDNSSFYGLGVMRMVVPDPESPTQWIGHTGGSSNAKGVLIYDLQRMIYVALVMNTDGAGEAVVNAVLKSLDEQ